MIIRLVKMHLKSNEVSAFKGLFFRSKAKIEAMPGCSAVNLHQDVKNPDIFFTISHWHTEEDLENYRNSDVFLNTWRKVKPLFQERAEAWSLT